MILCSNRIVIFSKNNIVYYILRERQRKEVLLVIPQFLQYNPVKLIMRYSYEKKTINVLHGFASYFC
jgi:hypothetical protein